MNDFAPQLVPQDSDLKSINDLVVKLLEKQTLAADLAFRLKEENEAIRRIEEQALPEALTLVGYKDGDKIKINGVEIKLVCDMQMSISAQKKPFVLNWLKSQGQEGIIKNQLNVDIPKGEAEEQISKVKTLLQELGFSYEQIENVNTLTVKSLLKSLLSDGQIIPLEDLGARTYNKATVKL